MLGFCNESLRGDRICDEINNNQDCEYDWGDCCRPVVQCPSIKTEFNETFFVNETICSNVTANSPLVPANSSIGELVILQRCHSSTMSFCNQLDMQPRL